MNKEFFHAKNEQLYCSIKDTIVNQIYHVVIGERKKKNWYNFLFVSTCSLKVNLWLIM